MTQGAVEGWWWRVGDSSAALPVIPFETICGATFPRTVTDGLGREVVIPCAAAADRIGDARIG